MCIAAVADLEAKKRLIRDFFDAWERGDFERFPELIDLDGEWWTLAKRVTRSVADQVKRHEGIHHETRDGVHFTLGSLTAEGDRVAVEVESHADLGDRGHYNNRYYFLFRIADDHIRQVWVYYDTDLANRVLRGEGTDLGPLPSHT